MEDSEDTNPVKESPSLPPNYVTLTMLKERWLQRKKEEEEEKLKQQQQNPQQETKAGIASGSKHGVTPTTRNQNRQESWPANVPRRPQQPGKNWRGAGGWAKRHEEPESSASVVIGGNLKNKGKKGKNYRKRRNPRFLENENSPENVAEKEEIPIVVSKESGGKSELHGDNGRVEERVSVCMVGVVSEKGVEGDIQKVSGGGRRRWKGWRGGFGRNKNKGMNSKAHKQVGELGEKEKKTEVGNVRVAEDRKENGQKGRKSGTGCSVMKIDMGFQDLLLDDREDANVTMEISGSYGQQENKQRMDFKVGKQVGELRRDKKKKVEEGGDGVAKNGRKNVRMRGSGSAGGGQGYRVDQAENRKVWVKKGEKAGGNASQFNS